MKIFVTGGAGFIGSNFIRHVLALDERHSVVNFDKLTYAGNLANLLTVATHPRYQFVKGDVGDLNAASEAMAGCDAVVHFAAESHVDRTIFEPATAMQTNLAGTFVLLQAARHLSVQRFLQVSTDEVYGDLPAGVVADEGFPLQPSSPYSASKAGADLLVRSFVRTYRFPALIARSSNNYGPNQFPEKFVPLMITRAFDDQPLPVYGDGRQQRDWLHVEDNCRGLMAVLLRGKVGEVYNLGGGEVLENLEMVLRLLKILRRPESLIQYVADRPGHDRRYALDCCKAARELAWRPLVPIQSGLEQTVQWYAENNSWVESIRRGEYLSYYQKCYENRDASLGALLSPGKDAVTSSDTAAGSRPRSDHPQ